MQYTWLFAMKTIRHKTVTSNKPHLSCLLLLALLCGKAASAQQPPIDESAALNEARAMLAAENYPGADKALRTILARTPDSGDGHFLLGFALLHEQKPTEALTEYTQGARFRDPRPEELLGVASAYILLKGYADAEHWLTIATKQAPSNLLAWYLLGRAQFNESHWNDAERSFLTCLRLDPQNVKAESNLGLVYEMLQRPDAAIAAYRSAISFQETAATKDPEPFRNLGMLLRKQGKVAEAIPLLAAAAGSGSRDVLAHQELGLAYEELGRYDEAIGELKAAIAIAPATSQAGPLHFFLGRVYRKAGRRDDAAREFADAARISGAKTIASLPPAGAAR